MSDELRQRYETNVCDPGRKWLDAHPIPKATERGQRPHPYWSKIQPDLAQAFHLRCAYTAMWINFDGTVDHAISIDEDRTKAYEWDNFRYCVGWFNSKKRNARSHQMLDPLLVESDWFELSWPDLQLKTVNGFPEQLRDKAEFMLEKLELRKGATVMRNRESYLEHFVREGESAMPFIERQAPLVAKVIKKNWQDALRLKSGHNKS